MQVTDIDKVQLQSQEKEIKKEMSRETEMDMWRKKCGNIETVLDKDMKRVRNINTCK